MCMTGEICLHSLRKSRNAGNGAINFSPDSRGFERRATPDLHSAWEHCMRFSGRNHPNPEEKPPNMSGHFRRTRLLFLGWTKANFIGRAHLSTAAPNLLGLTATRAAATPIRGREAAASFHRVFEGETTRRDGPRHVCGPRPCWVAYTH